MHTFMAYQSATGRVKYVSTISRASRNSWCVWSGWFSLSLRENTRMYYIMAYFYPFTFKTSAFELSLLGIHIYRSGITFRSWLDDDVWMSLFCSYLQLYTLFDVIILLYCVRQTCNRNFFIFFFWVAILHAFYSWQTSNVQFFFSCFFLVLSFSFFNLNLLITHCTLKKKREQECIILN